MQRSSFAKIGFVRDGFRLVFVDVCIRLNVINVTHSERLSLCFDGNECRYAKIDEMGFAESVEKDKKKKKKITI